MSGEHAFITDLHVRVLLIIAGSLLALDPGWAHPQKSFREIARQALPASVSVQASGARRNTGNPFSDPALRGLFEPRNATDEPTTPTGFQSMGSGFAWGNGDYIVTEYSVVAEGDAFQVTTHDGRHLPATLVGADPHSSVALLTVPGLRLPVIPMGTTDVAPGDPVMAIGAPFGMTQSVSVGVVSALARALDDGPADALFLQSDVTIQPGSSGGPLLDEHGRLLGMTIAVISRTGRHEGVSLFVPVADLAFVANQLQRSGEARHGWLGVNAQDLTADLGRALQVGDDRGAVVISVEGDSPAERAGVKAGDLVTAIDDSAIATAAELAHGISYRLPGTAVQLAIRRNGMPITVSTTLGARTPSARQ